MVVARELYAAILDRIEAQDYDVFSRRAQISRPGKLWSPPGAPPATPVRSLTASATADRLGRRVNISRIEMPVPVVL